MRFYFSLFVAKLLFAAIKILGKSGGTSFAGLMMLKICPDFLFHAAGHIKGAKVSVTGTNGKTTTAGVLSHIFESAGKKVIHNDKGANMLSGVANVFAQELSPFKHFDNCVIESDEAYLTKLFDFIDFNYLIVTNLFHDQLDRHGELDITASKIDDAIKKNPKLKLLLNADDPRVASFKNAASTVAPVYFGFDSVKSNLKTEAVPEIVNCKCGKELEYKEVFYSHQGHYHCNCGYKRPDCKYCATLELFEDYSIIKINEHKFTLSLLGLYNAYNALAAISLALECNLGQAQIQNALNSYVPMLGRYQKCKIKGRESVIQLIKNPTGASEVLKTVDLKSNILIAINDNYADGRDMSWLWDTDFERIKNIEGQIVVSGIRAADVGLRLKYADIKESRITVIEDVKKAFDYILENSTQGSKLSILPSYTALSEIAKLI